MQEWKWKVSFEDFEPGNVSFHQKINYYFGNVKQYRNRLIKGRMHLFRVFFFFILTY